MAATDWGLKKNGDTPLELYEKLVQTERMKDARWKWFALASFFCLLIAIGVMIYAINLPRTVPLVITVSEWGESKYVGPATNLSYTGLKIPPVAIEYQIRKFVNNKYAVPTDGAILKQNLIDCYSCLTTDCAQKLTNEIKGGDDPRAILGERIRTVDIETLLKLSDKSYQVDFYVTTTDLGGSVKSKDHIRGVLTMELLEPSPEDQRLNPLGIYFSNFDFTTIERVATGTN